MPTTPTSPSKTMTGPMLDQVAAVARGTRSGGRGPGTRTRGKDADEPGSVPQAPRHQSAPDRLPGRPPIAGPREGFFPSASTRSSNSSAKGRIGRGSTGRSSEGQGRSASRVLPGSKARTRDLARVRPRRKLLTRLDHPNVVRESGREADAGIPGARIHRNGDTLGRCDGEKGKTPAARGRASRLSRAVGAPAIHETGDDPTD